jgi:hypothetical protein
MGRLEGHEHERYLRFAPSFNRFLFASVSKVTFEGGVVVTTTDMFRSSGYPAQERTHVLMYSLEDRLAPRRVYPRVNPRVDRTEPFPKHGPTIGPSRSPYADRPVPRREDPRVDQPISRREDPRVDRADLGPISDE